MGTLNLNNNATLNLVAQNSEITSTNAVSFIGTNNYLSLSGIWGSGTYTLLSGTSITGTNIALTGQAPGYGTVTLGTGTATVGRSTYAFADVNNSLVLTTVNGAYNLIWSGSQDKAWNTTSANWQQVTNPGVNIAFTTLDNVTFGDAAALSPITVTNSGVFAGIVNVSNTTGTVTLGGGTITAGTFTASGSGSLVVSNAISLPGGQFISAGSGNTVLTGGIPSSAGIIQSGTGTLLLSGGSVYAGSTTITSGTLQIGANNTFVQGSLISEDSATRSVY